MQVHKVRTVARFASAAALGIVGVVLMVPKARATVHQVGVIYQNPMEPDPTTCFFFYSLTAHGLGFDANGNQVCESPTSTTGQTIWANCPSSAVATQAKVSARIGQNTPSLICESRVSSSWTSQVNCWSWCAASGTTESTPGVGAQAGGADR